MKKALFLTMMVVAAVLVSCGSRDKKDEGSEANEVTTTDPALNCASGGLDLSDYISVESVSKPTVIKADNTWSELSVSAKLKVIKKLDLQPADFYGKPHPNAFLRIASIDLCDENEATVVVANEPNGPYNLESLIGAEPGKVVTVSMKTNTKGFSKEADENLKKIKKIRVNTESQLYEFATDAKTTEEQDKSSQEQEKPSEEKDE